MRFSTLGSAALVAACAVAGLAALPAAGSALPRPTPDRGVWVTDGPVRAIAAGPDGTTYIGGDFSRVGPRTGSGVAVDAVSGVRTAGYPFVDGAVYAAAPDGDGGVFIGGIFRSVGGVARAYLAHIRADGSVDRSFDPHPDGAVRALAVSGPVLYAGGDFGRVGGRRRSGLAALDARGHATAWDPHPDDASEGGPPVIFALAVSGSRVYAGGDFGRLAGQDCSGIAAVDKTTGAATGWSAVAWWVPEDDPEFDLPGRVFAIAVSDDTVYIGGDFTSVDGVPRSCAAALDAETAAVTAWDPDPSGVVWALATAGDTIYAGGTFGHIGGRQRSAVAAVDEDGAATDWDAGADGVDWPIVSSLALAGSTLYVGGEFDAIGGARRHCVAALGVGDASAAAWNPCAGGTVSAVVPAGSAVFLGGSFALVGGTSRDNIAQLDARGRVTAWDPGADGPVDALAVSGSTVYAGGEFTAVGGQSRARIAALGGDGRATAWDPGADGPVTALAVSGPTMYAGGAFTAIGGESRGHLAALDGDGHATQWRPVVLEPADPFSPVRAIAVTPTTVYAGDTLTLYGFDTATAAAVPVPETVGAVNALVRRGTRMYVGGDFGTFGRTARNGLALFDVRTGRVAAWRCNHWYDVSALAGASGVLFVGGDRGIGAVSMATGRRLPWSVGIGDPEAGYGSIDVLALSGSALYAGGRFAAVAGGSRSNLARFSPRK